MRYLPLVLLFCAAQGFAAQPVVTGARDACTPRESWTYGADVANSTRAQFNSFLRKELSAARGFSLGWALLDSGGSPEAERMGEYWMSSALFELGDVHDAWSGFSALASRPPEETTIGIQLSAIDCLNRINTIYPSFETAESVSKLLGQYLSKVSSDRDRTILWEYGTRHARSLIGSRDPRALEAVLRNLNGSGPYEAFVRGLIASQKGDHATAVAELTQVKKAGSTSPSLSAIKDQTHLLIARAEYARKNYPAAIHELKAIDKSSNELAEALSELSWSTLMARKYSEAIGAAINLQSGGLRRTFQPEALMVTAIAFTEMCQYPESLRAINSFKKVYATPWFWLDRWTQQGPANLYPLAVSYLKKERIEVPQSIAGEWVRTPSFISSQEEINLLSSEGPALASTSRAAETEKKAMAQKLRLEMRTLKARIAAERGAQKTYSTQLATLSPALQRSIHDFQVELQAYRYLRSAAGPWRAIVDRHDSRTATVRKGIVDRINTQLARLNARMFLQLQEIAENNRLIEIEIYNGASSDLIWQNAHPDYKDLAARMQDPKARVAASKTWNWGHVPVLAEDWSEIWEHEPGSFKVDIADNCRNKDRYMTIKAPQLARSD